MTSADVEYSFNQAINNPVTANVTSLMSEMKAIDKYTCELHLKQAFGPIESCLVNAQMSIVNKAACEADPDAFGRNPIGTGPYAFVRWDPGDKIVLKAFEDYWEGAAQIKDLTFKITLDLSAALMAIESGEIHFCDTIPNAQKSIADNNPDMGYASIGAPATWFLQLNLSRAPFDDENFRKAIAYAIDPEAVVIGACGGLGVANRSIISNTVNNFPENWESIYTYDLDKAREYLSKSAYPDGVDVVMTCMDDGRFIAISEIIVESLRQIGINFTLDKMERATYMDVVRMQHDYNCVIMSTNPIYAESVSL